jgi:Arc/MetJ-type ribon-helix-helix transcriptional regulator
VKTLSLTLPESLDVRLAALARRRGASKSEVVREALEALLENGSRRGKGPSAMELASELCGCVKGTGDLSHNRKHMESFGR